jgi:hypothetical protein
MRLELDVANTIAAKSAKMTHDHVEEIRKMQFVLRIPRVRDEYLKKKGVD